MPRILPRDHRTLALAGIVCLALAAGIARAEPDADGRPVTLTAFAVTPASPGGETLCRLEATIENYGEHVASQLGFSVRINDQELAVYGNQLFMYPIEPGQKATIPLYNFWSTETSRPMPADGKLRIEVSLLEARWFDISIDDEGVEVWQPVAPVDGLPSAQTLVLEMTR
jgi:hypothetical protein